VFGLVGRTKTFPLNAQGDPNRDLVYFRVKVNGDGSATFKWKMAAEIDKAGFNIYRLNN
jgi:hypothetical protein